MNDDCVIWTGTSGDEVKRFAKDNGFLIFVGANFTREPGGTTDSSAT